MCFAFPEPFKPNKSKEVLFIKHSHLIMNIKKINTEDNQFMTVFTCRGKEEKTGR